MCESGEFCRNIIELLLSMSQKSLGVRNYFFQTRALVYSPQSELLLSGKHTSQVHFLCPGTAGLFSGVLLLVFQRNNIGIAN